MSAYSSHPPWVESLVVSNTSIFDLISLPVLELSTSHYLTSLFEECLCL